MRQEQQDRFILLQLVTKKESTPIYFHYYADRQLCYFLYELYKLINYEIKRNDN